MSGVLDILWDLLTDPEAILFLALGVSALLAERVIRRHRRVLQRLARGLGLREVRLHRLEDPDGERQAMGSVPSVELRGKLGAREVGVLRRRRAIDGASELELRVQLRPGTLPAGLCVESELRTSATRSRDLLDSDDELDRALRLDARDADAARRLFADPAVREALRALWRDQPELRLVGEELIVSGLPSEGAVLRATLQEGVALARELERAARAGPTAAADLGSGSLPQVADDRPVRALRAAPAAADASAGRSAPLDVGERRRVQAAYARTRLRVALSVGLGLGFALVWIVVWVAYLGEWLQASSVLLGTVIGVCLLALTGSLVLSQVGLRCPACGAAVTGTGRGSSIFVERCPGCGVRLR